MKLIKQGTKMIKNNKAEKQSVSSKEKWWWKKTEKKINFAIHKEINW